LEIEELCQNYEPENNYNYDEYDTDFLIDELEFVIKKFSKFKGPGRDNIM